MKKVAVILSGCGVFDGAEIHEAVISLLALARQGATTQCFAPNVAQHHVINHMTGDVSEGESRNVLVESARLVRGDSNKDIAAALGCALRTAELHVTAILTKSGHPTPFRRDWCIRAMTRSLSVPPTSLQKSARPE